MRYKLALILGAALLLAAGLAALEQTKAQGGCCAPEKSPKAGGAATTPEPLRCTLTGKTVESCCCTEKDGASTLAQRGERQSNHKLYCPLAKKSIDSCCCVPSNAAQAKGGADDEQPLRCGRDEKTAGNCCAHADHKREKR